MRQAAVVSPSSPISHISHAKTCHQNSMPKESKCVCVRGCHATAVWKLFQNFPSLSSQAMRKRAHVREMHACRHEMGGDGEEVKGRQEDRGRG